MLVSRHKAVRSGIVMSIRSLDFRVLAGKIWCSLEVSLCFLLVCLEVSCAGQNIGFLRFWLYLQCWCLPLLSFRRGLLKNGC